jgi:hypothetical protein
MGTETQEGEGLTVLQRAGCRPGRNYFHSFPMACAGNLTSCLTRSWAIHSTNLTVSQSVNKHFLRIHHTLDPGDMKVGVSWSRLMDFTV